MEKATYDPFYSTAPSNLIVGSGAPTQQAAKGSLYVNATASTSSTRLYINTDGGTTWASFTASA